MQIGTPWSDGTEGVTQCPILPGETFIYKFVVDRVSQSHELDSKTNFSKDKIILLLLWIFNPLCLR